MTKDELHELADEILSDIDIEPEWEMDLGDCFAAFYPENVAGNESCIVIFQNNLNGEIENVKEFNTEEEAEDYLNQRQAEWAEVSCNEEDEDE